MHADAVECDCRHRLHAEPTATVDEGEWRELCPGRRGQRQRGCGDEHHAELESVLQGVSLVEPWRRADSTNGSSDWCSGRWDALSTSGAKVPRRTYAERATFMGAGRHAGAAASSLSAMDLQAETAEVLARLIRFHTVNPPGDERACRSGSPPTSRTRGSSASWWRRGRRAAEPRRPPARRGRRPGARLPLPRRHRARRPGRVGARPVVGRGARRLPVGPRRDRHEVPDRRRGGRRRAPRALGLAAARAAS